MVAAWLEAGPPLWRGGDTGWHRRPRRSTRPCTDRRSARATGRPRACSPSRTSLRTWSRTARALIETQGGWPLLGLLAPLTLPAGTRRAAWLVIGRRDRARRGLPALPSVPRVVVSALPAAGCRAAGRARFVDAAATWRRVARLHEWPRRSSWWPRARWRCCNGVPPSSSGVRTAGVRAAFPARRRRPFAIGCQRAPLRSRSGTAAAFAFMPIGKPSCGTRWIQRGWIGRLRG